LEAASLEQEAVVLLAVLTVLVGALAVLQDDHSRHRHAVAGLGTVNFPTSCNATAQKWISRAVALLHSFGYEEARLAFQEAANADRSCGMAYWGLARTWYHPIWAPPAPAELQHGAAAIEQALAAGAQTERERDYIRALAVFYKDWQTVDHRSRVMAYERALDDVQGRHPDDDEAAIFHALQLLAVGYLDPADKTYAWQNKGLAVLNRLLPRHPDHPGIAHYIIHSVDYPELAEQGLPAARAYAKIAPESAHALHMPSHIFTRLGMWDDSVASNLASARAAVARAQRLHGGGGAFDQLHAMDYLVYAYLQQARDTSAWEVLQEMRAITRLDEHQFAAAYAFGASPARWTLERRDWKAAAALQVEPAWFPWQRFRNAEALLHYARAIGAARTGAISAARRSAEQIAAIRRELPRGGDYDWSGSLGAQWEAANALIIFAEGNTGEALRLLRAAADHEDAVDKHPVTPGHLLPVRELLADLLLETGALEEALKEYEAVLKTAPRRFRSTAGAAQAAAAAGDTQTARAYAAQLLEIARQAEVARPELVWARNFVAGH
jgi:tetratricopeptide (TPR) repeat protein